MISLCMTTYNGERYIEEQLQSILEQTRKPDEVIIVDDCSRDLTVYIVHEFIRTHHLENSWSLFCNMENKGYPENFYYAMSMCKGDFVFLADQDDIWEKDKIKKMSDVMTKHSEIMLLASKWGMIDSTGEKIKSAMEVQSRNSNLIDSVSVERILYKYEWPGMSMCYRMELGQKALERARKAGVAHDVALALIAAENATFFVLDKEYQYHRRHGNNTAMEESKIHKLLDKNRKLLEIENYLEMLKRIEESECLIRDDNRKLISTKYEIMKERKHNLEQGDRRNIIRQYTEHRKDIRFATAACDWLICKKQ